MITTFFLLMLSCCAFGQTRQDTIVYLQQQAKIYLTEMYVHKNFDSASKMWDKRMLWEMEDFYQKEKQGHFTDTILFNRVRADVTKYLTQLDKFKIEKILKSSLEEDPNYKMGYIFFEYKETLKSKSKKVKSMLAFISEDKGSTWVIQDWKIKYIADQLIKKHSEIITTKPQ